MKQRPILFSTPMVQAILAGRKTQTRRVVKPQPPEQFSNFGNAIAFVTPKTLNHTVWCPYGQPGDVLWVRETWQPSASGAYVHFKADIIGEDAGKGWKPSIHMPKDACRLFLRITNVGVERLHEISEQDAINEGIERLPPLHWWKNYIDQPLPGTSLPSLSFMTLWKSINGEQSWNDNPWVWVIEFERVEGGGDMSLFCGSCPNCGCVGIGTKCYNHIHPQPIHETLFYSTNQGEGFTCNPDETLGLEDRGEFMLGNEVLNLLKETTLDGFFDFPHRFEGFNCKTGMVFFCGYENDLFGGTRYFKVIHLLTPKRIFVMYTPKSGRDYNFINGVWK